MTESRDPPRLLGADDPAFAELTPGLREARRQGPTAEQQARMRAALGLPPATPPGSDPAGNAKPAAGHAPAAPHPDGSASAAAPWLKLVAFGALALVALAGSQRWLPFARSAEVAQPRATAGQPNASPAPVREEAASQPSAAAAEPAMPSIEPRAAPRLIAGAPAAALRRQRPVAEQPVDAAAELTLLRAAKAHARSAPERALALLAEHEQRFARSAMTQEREVITVEALLASGRRAQAEQRAARFIARFPDSAHVRRVRALLAELGRADSDTKTAPRPNPSR